MNEDEEKRSVVTMEHIEHILNGLREIKSLCARNKQDIDCIKETVIKDEDSKGKEQNSGDAAVNHKKDKDDEDAEGSEDGNEEEDSEPDRQKGDKKKLVYDVEVDTPTCKKKIYDLPTFSGELDQWPLFYANLSESTRIFKYSNRENLMRLQKCLVGAAREAVASMLIYPNHVPNAIEELQHRFGKPELLAREQLHKLQDLSAFGESKMDQLVFFATKVRNCVALMVSAECEHYLADTLTLEMLVRKIPPSKQYEWVQYAANLHPYPTIASFSEWLNEIARVVCLLPTPMTSKKTSQGEQGSLKSKVVMHVKEGDNQKSGKCHHCAGTHKLLQCSEFLTSDVSKRWDIVKSQQLCFVCLNKGHGVAKCRSKKPCGIGECKRFHNPVLHETHSSNTTHMQAVLSCRTTRSSDKLFKILPVTLCGPKGRMQTYAIFDDGSAMSLIEENVADQLGLGGQKHSITLQWFGGKISTEKSRRVDLEIYGDDSAQRFSLKGVNTVANLSLPTQTFVKADFPHLHEFAIEDYVQVKPVILLGLDSAHLEIPSEVTDNTNPVAARTKLGWVAYGSKNADSNPQPIVLHINQRDDELHVLVESYFKTENFGTNDLRKQLMSDENIHAKHILESTTKRIGNRFEVGLLWKEKQQELPDSYENAKKRLLSIEKKINIDKKFGFRYVNEMSKYFDKGYAKVLSNDEIQVNNIKIWYLPHFAVTSVHKPEKCRIVFDAAATVKGVSLNSQLSKGPEQAKPLMNVLFNFRMDLVGVAADIREMFSQIKIRPDDQHAQRFLWRNAQSKQIQHCVMTSIVFGATCSPCCAEFVKNKNANEYREKFPQAAAAIIDQHYVDDFVASFPTEDAAIKLCKQVVEIHSNAGFELRNFVSNSECLEVELNGCQREADHLVNMQCQSPAEKVLGMYWSKTKDVFEFHTKFHRVPKEVVDGVRAPTKREMLSIAMSVFDPFGLIADFLLLSKILIQQTWKCDIGWDDPVPDEIFQKWRQWWRKFAELKYLQVPRCYSRFLSSARSIELHIFVDASSQAFVAAAYFRIATGKSADVCFVFGKTRNAPKRLLSIPRLELQAAVLGVRVSKIVQEAHAITFSRIVFWTDSKTVFYWIHSSERKYSAFVGHRISEIFEYTRPHQWCWVSTKFNSADAATRPIEISSF